MPSWGHVVAGKFDFFAKNFGVIHANRLCLIEKTDSFSGGARKKGLHTKGLQKL